MVGSSLPPFLQFDRTIEKLTYGATAWKDRLTGYNNGTITYDTIGNPTSYLGATLTWRGRELSSYSKNGKQISYSYDVDGMRYQKIVKNNGTETARYDYVYSDDKLILLTHTANGVANTARFIYDSFGEPRGFILNNSASYLYLKNGQGDITAIVDENGEILVRYTYNAWGAVEFIVPFGIDPSVTTVLATVSPFTYRGYFYDFDLGLYYLQSRYYDPEICRFINADSTDYLGATGTLLSYNLFAYCENDPVDWIDPSGCYKDYAFTILPRMNDADIVYKISKVIEDSGKMGLEATTKYIPFSGEKYYKYNVANVSYKYSNKAIYVKYSGFPLGGCTVYNFYYSTYFHTKTYVEWLLYIVNRSKTIFDKIDEKAMDLLGFDEWEWATFTNDVGQLTFTGLLSFVPDFLTIYDMLSVITGLLKKWMDKPSKYVMEILERRPNLEKSNKKIAILWTISYYRYGFLNSGTGYRKGWHNTKTYYAWNI